MAGSIYHIIVRMQAIECMCAIVRKIQPVQWIFCHIWCWQSQKEDHRKPLLSAQAKAILPYLIVQLAARHPIWFDGGHSFETTREATREWLALEPQKDIWQDPEAGKCMGTHR